MSSQDEEERSLQLEGRSAVDRAWYDCEVVVRGGSLFMRFEGYSTDEEEPLRELSALRFSSLAAEPADCPQLVPGTRVTGFKRSPKEEVWVDAEVVARKPGRHDAGHCTCSFTVKWLDTADAGRTVELRVGDMCLWDPRPLRDHPQYRRFAEMLEGRQPQQARQAQQGKQPQGKQQATGGEDGPIELSGSEEEEQGGGGGTGLGTAADVAPAKPFPLRPPLGASGTRCDLCKLPVLLADDPVDAEACPEAVQRDFSGVFNQSFAVHRRCAAFSDSQTLRYVGQYIQSHDVPGAFRSGFGTEVREAQSHRCSECGETGASASCTEARCQHRFHLHCAAKCKVDADHCTLRCPGHSVLGGLAAVKANTFYPSRTARDKELEQMRMGTYRTPGRLQGLKQRGSRAALTGSLDFAASKRQGGAAAQPETRRSGRHAEKRKKYNEAALEAGGFSESWQREVLKKARRGGSDLESEGEDDSSSGDEQGIRYADDSDDGSGGAFAERPVRGGQKRSKPRESPARRTERQRNKVKSYAEEQDELELRMEAYRAEHAAQNGYEDVRCEVCDAKTRGKEMLLCDGCDRGFHMFCLDPPLAAAPLASWYCPHCLTQQDCETCGQAAAGKAHRHKRQAAGLIYCHTCGALCHADCMEEDAGELRCTLCVEGLQEAGVEAILGCRTPAQRGEAREYFVKFKERSHRRCRWVTQRTAQRMAPSQLARFQRDSRDAASVEPNVQEQWLQVERVVAKRREGRRDQCLVKWRGLDYDKATWEPQADLAAEQGALERFERRQALRVERDAAAEAAARARELAPLLEQPAFLAGVGTLKDYQLEGITWVLAKLRAGMSGILGDEMGLGKTIQTAVSLQLAHAAGLTTGPVAVVVPLSTIGSWEREMARWAPGLEVLSYSGMQEARAIIRKLELGSEEDDMEAVRRKATTLVPRFHVMLTTYDVVLRDTAVLRRFDWSALVIDEGHSLKGENSLRGQRLRELGAPWRLLLTGTPLQNNLRELLALLAFLADTSIEKIEKRVALLEDPNPPPQEVVAAEDADSELLQAQAYIRKLHAYLEPRMLRRMKAVCLAGQMPPKISRKVACRMTPLQLSLYSDVLAKDFDKVNAMVRSRLEKKSMTNILIRLRQACNHPYLLPGQEPEQYKDPESPELAEEGWRLMVAASGKLTLLQQLLPRLMARGHRVLIFSQYVEMLDILEDFLHDFQDTSGLLPQAQEDPARDADSAAAAAAAEGREAEERSGQEGGEAAEEEPHDLSEEAEFTRGRPGSVIRYFRLDGKSKSWQRQAMMDSFNAEGCRVQVFLISTRAGSLGINLQSADTVILYDPDFNPFVDAQAEGRAHRLGQESTVLVYQMYTADCVEERILELAARKRKLEELVTRHLGRARGVSDEDIKSSVLHGWGNLMRQAHKDGTGGADLALSDADLERLLDRSHVFADDLASGADAATLLGEVRAGNAAHMQFEAAGGEGEGGEGAAPPGRDADMEAAMHRLLAERARKYEQDKAAKEELGRGRRARGSVQGANAEDRRGIYYESDADDSPDKPARGAAGRKRQAGQASNSDDEYDPARSPGHALKAIKGIAGAGGSGENAQPNSGERQYSSDSSGDDSSDSQPSPGYDSSPPAAPAAPPHGAVQAQGQFTAEQVAILQRALAAYEPQQAAALAAQLAQAVAAAAAAAAEQQRQQAVALQQQRQQAVALQQAQAQAQALQQQQEQAPKPAQPPKQARKQAQAPRQSPKHAPRQSPKQAPKQAEQSQAPGQTEKKQRKKQHKVVASPERAQPPAQQAKKEKAHKHKHKKHKAAAPE